MKIEIDAEQFAKDIKSGKRWSIKLINKTTNKSYTYSRNRFSFNTRFE